MADNIVTDWLRSLYLVHYTQAFLDNGYDDLEICKQIGEPDLDAIGVHKPEHRYRILEAVRILREQGGTAVYFTLENPEGPCPNNVLDGVGLIGGDGGVGCVNSDIYHHTAGLGGVGATDRTVGETPVPDTVHCPRRLTDDYEEGKSALLTYPKIQLKHIIRDKLVRDDIDLSGPPYTTPDQSGTRSSLMALAIKYAGELKTHIEDVFDRLEELRWWKITKDSDSLSTEHSRNLIEENVFLPHDLSMQHPLYILDISSLGSQLMQYRSPQQPLDKFGCSSRRPSLP